jgi:serine/threonine protein kinase
MRALNHKNIMKIIEIFDSDTSIKIVMELAEGGNLENYFKKGHELKWS